MPDDRALEVEVARRSVELGRTEGEDPTVATDQPVTVARRLGGHRGGFGGGGTGRAGDRQRADHGGELMASASPAPLPAGPGPSGAGTAHPGAIGTEPSACTLMSGPPAVHVPATSVTTSPASCHIELARTIAPEAPAGSIWTPMSP